MLPLWLAQPYFRHQLQQTQNTIKTIPVVTPSHEGDVGLTGTTLLLFPVAVRLHNYWSNEPIFYLCDYGVRQHHDLLIRYLLEDENPLPGPSPSRLGWTCYSGGMTGLASFFFGGS